MSRITLTQLQYDVLDGLQWGQDSTPADLAEWEVKAKLPSIKKALAQLLRKGFVRVRGQQWNINRFGLSALNLIVAQVELTAAQEKFTKEQKRRQS